MLQQPVGDLVRAGRAAGTPVLPLRIEHEVLDDELAASLEEAGQADLAVRSLEDVVLVDPHHRQPAPVSVEGVPGPGELLLSREQRLASRVPLVVRNDLGQGHGWPPSIRSDTRWILLSPFRR